MSSNNLLLAKAKNSHKNELETLQSNTTKNIASCSYINNLNINVSTNDPMAGSSTYLPVLPDFKLHEDANRWNFEFNYSVQDRNYIPESKSEHNDNVTNLAPVKQTKRIRRSKSEPSQWKRNIIKQQTLEGKQPKPVDCSKCRFKCNTNISEENRKKLCKAYWACNFVRRKDFILNNVQSCLPQQRRQRADSKKKPRKESRAYFLPVERKNKIRVCQNFFSKTLCISNGVVDHAFCNRGDGNMFDGEDKRGKTEPTNKTPIEDIEKVKRHIERFPTIKSHYKGKSAKREYLDSNLTIAKMHALYVEECEKDGSQAVRQNIYRRIFCTDYNLSFYKPKKIECQTRTTGSEKKAV